MGMVGMDFGELSGGVTNPQYKYGGGTTDTIATNLDIKYVNYSKTRVVENDYFELSCTNGSPTASVTVTVKKACTVLKETWDVNSSSGATSYTPTTETVTLTQGQNYTLSRVSDAFLIRLTVQQ